MNPNHTSAALKTAALLAFGGLLAGCDSGTRQLPPDKQAIVLESEEQARQSKLHEAPPNPNGQPPAELATPPEPEWRTGIIEDHAAPFPGSMFRLENQWQQVAGARHLNVYAGALGEDPQQGVLIVQTTPVADLANPSAPVFVQTPTRAGALRIVSENGTVLTVRAEDGSTYLFDAASATLRAQ